MKKSICRICYREIQEPERESRVLWETVERVPFGRYKDSEHDGWFFCDLGWYKEFTRRNSIYPDRYHEPLDPLSQLVMETRDDT